MAAHAGSDDGAAATADPRTITRAANRYDVDHCAEAAPAVAPTKQLDTDHGVNKNSLNRLLARGADANATVRTVPVIGVNSRTLRTGPVAVGAALAPTSLPAGPNTEAANTAAAGPDTGRHPRWAARPIGAPSPAVVARLDGGHRLAAVKTTDWLGWRDGDALHARCEPGRVTIAPGPGNEPTDLRVTFDSRKHLRLPTTAVAALGVSAKDQIFAAGTCRGTLVLVNASALAEMVAGTVSPHQQPAPVPPQARPRRSTVREPRHAPTPAVALA